MSGSCMVGRPLALMWIALSFGACRVVPSALCMTRDSYHQRNSSLPWKQNTQTPSEGHSWIILPTIGKVCI